MNIPVGFVFASCLENASRGFKFLLAFSLSWQ